MPTSWSDIYMSRGEESGKLLAEAIKEMAHLMYVSSKTLNTM